jgi:hypothetical protein
MCDVLVGSLFDVINAAVLRCAAPAAIFGYSQLRLA